MYIKTQQMILLTCIVSGLPNSLLFVVGHRGSSPSRSRLHCSLLLVRVHRLPRPTLSRGVIINKFACRYTVHLHVHWACHSRSICQVCLYRRGHPLLIRRLPNRHRLSPTNESSSTAAGTSLHQGRHRGGNWHYTATCNYRSGHPKLTRDVNGYPGSRDPNLLPEPG